MAEEEEEEEGGWRGLCQRRCDARLAGQLKTLSHSEQRYSTWMMRGHRCCARQKASSKTCRHSRHR